MNTQELNQFTGTENYYSSSYYCFVYTDGVKYVAKNGGCHWLLSQIAISQLEKKFRENEKLQFMQFWTLTVNKNKSAFLICEEDKGILISKIKIPLQIFLASDYLLSLQHVSLLGVRGERRGNSIDKFSTLILPSEY